MNVIIAGGNAYRMGPAGSLQSAPVNLDGSVGPDLDCWCEVSDYSEGRALQPQSEARIAWERDVLDAICDIDDCTNSDAQSITEVPPFAALLDWLFPAGIAPRIVAAFILNP